MAKFVKLGETALEVGIRNTLEVAAKDTAAILVKVTADVAAITARDGARAGAIAVQKNAALAAAKASFVDSVKLGMKGIVAKLMKTTPEMAAKVAKYSVKMGVGGYMAYYCYNKFTLKDGVTFQITSIVQDGDVTTITFMNPNQVKMFGKNTIDLTGTVSVPAMNKTLVLPSQSMATSVNQFIITNTVGTRWTSQTGSFVCHCNIEDEISGQTGTVLADVATGAAGLAGDAAAKAAGTAADILKDFLNKLIDWEGLKANARSIGTFLVLMVCAWVVFKVFL